MKDAGGAGEAIGVLSKLPVFLELAGRRAVVAGDSSGLAWKAELLAAAGADVLVLSPDPSPEMRALLARPRAAGAGAIAFEARAWSAVDFAGAAVAVADLAADEAEAFKAAAQAAGVIANTVDKPATCDFFFGSIVSRSPVVIGISTDGLAPILGQAIRRAVEIAAPEWLGGWAELARELRPEAMRRLDRGGQRRAFWEAFSDAAMAGPLDDASRADMIARLQQIEREGSGRAGSLHEIVAPLHADCLRICDVKRMQAADVIIEEPGAPAAIRVYYRREARRLRIGAADEPGQIGATALDGLCAGEARAGKRVVVVRATGGARSCRCARVAERATP